MSINKDISCFGNLTKNIKLAVMKIKDYPGFTLYQVYKHIQDKYIHSEEFFMLMNSGYFKAQGKLDQIIDKVLGDDK